MRVPYSVLPGTRLPTSSRTRREQPAPPPPVIPLPRQSTINRMLGLSSDLDPELESQTRPR